MPTFEVISLPEAKLRTATGRQAQNVREYAEYIQRLGKGQAGVLHAAEDEKITTIKRRLTVAAEMLGQDLTVKRSGDELYFWLEPSEEAPRRKRQYRRRAQTRGKEAEDEARITEGGAGAVYR